MTPDELKTHCLIRICDDDEDLAAALELFLSLEGWKTVVFHDAKSFLTGDRPSVPGCLILDVKMPGFSGLECQALMKEHDVKLPVIFITGHGDIDMAVQAVLDGACRTRGLLPGYKSAKNASFWRSRNPPKTPRTPSYAHGP